MQMNACSWPVVQNRPLLGTNGTEAMSVLLERNQGHLVDYLKVGPFMGRPAVAALAPRFPLLLHLDDTLSDPDLLNRQTLENLQQWVHLTGTPWTSEHIGFGVAKADLQSALMPHSEVDLLTRERALTRIVQNARQLADALPVPLLLENVPFFPNIVHLNICEPGFVNEVLSQSGCNLLLDLAHARVSASVLHMDVHDYLEALPLDRVIEIHLSGPRRVREMDTRLQKRVWENADSVTHRLAFDSDCLIDAHEPLRQEDYHLLQWTLSRCTPQAISLEYYYEAAPLHEQLLRLGEMIGRPDGVES